MPEHFRMGDQLAGFDQILQAIGGLGFVVALIVVAVQYRRRLRDIKRLEGAVVELANNLRAALAKVEVYERVQPGGSVVGSDGDGADAPGRGLY